MQKRRGEAWEKESRAWRQVDVRRAVPDHCYSHTLRWSFSSLPNNELYWRCLLNVTVSCSWIRYYKKDLKILVGHRPPHGYLHIYLTWCIFFSQAFPLRFCILQAIKYWKQERLRNEANTYSLVRFQFSGPFQPANTPPGWKLHIVPRMQPLQGQGSSFSAHLC